MVLATAIILAGVISGNPFADLRDTKALAGYKEVEKKAYGYHTGYRPAERYFLRTYIKDGVEVDLFVHLLPTTEDVGRALTDKSAVRAAAQIELPMADILDMGAKIYAVGSLRCLEVDVFEGRVWTRFQVKREGPLGNASVSDLGFQGSVNEVRKDKERMKVIKALIPEIRERAKKLN
jgi:hypothetical protein